MKIATLSGACGRARFRRWSSVAVFAALLLAATNLFAATTATTVEIVGGGGRAGYVDGATYEQAFFSTPCGIAVDSTGEFLFIADRDNNAIRQVDLLYDETTTFAVQSINKPVGVALDSSGNVYVLNRGSGNNGTVVEFDGQFGDLIVTNAANLINATAMTLDASGNIFVTIKSNTLIRITAPGVSNVVATVPNAGAFLSGIVLKKSGSSAGLLAVCDSGRNGIYLIDPTSGAITTNAGFHGAGDFPANSPDKDSSANAKFNQPMGVVEAGDGSLVVADYGNHRVKVVRVSDGTVTNLFGVTNADWVSPYPGFSSSAEPRLGRPPEAVKIPDTVGGVSARLPFGVAIAPDGSVYVTEDYYHIIRHVAGAGFPLPPPPPPVPPAPVIGTVSFPAPDYLSLLTPVTSFVFNNDVIIAITSTNGTETFYTSGATGTVPDPSTSSSTAPFYQDGLSSASVSDLGTTRYPDMTIKAITVNGDGESSPETSARFQFVVANPTISGNNAGQFTVTDTTSNALMYYTVDGSDPTNDGSGTSIGPISSGATLSLQIPAGTNLTFKIRGFRANYQPSQIAPAVFTPASFVANTISFGFASGEASSDFVASPGQTFYAPVTLTTLPGTIMYSLQLNLTVSTGPTNPAPPLASSPGLLGFQPMLMKPIPGTTPVLYTNIPTYMFVSGMGFTNLTFVTNNLIGVGWVERAGATNLYDTTKQTLITYSLAHDDLFPNPNQPNEVIVGAYSFQVPGLGVTNGQTYKIQIGRPSATSDGVGAPGSSVFIDTPTNGSLTSGAINAIKTVTIGSRKYLVGNVYPFRWFNAGDFGNTNLQNADVEQVFQSAIYGLNTPPYNPNSWNGFGYTNVSDFFDAMDSCGVIGIDSGLGYLKQSVSIGSNTNVLFNGNNATINQIAFGDGQLDACDVYVTYRRSLDTNDLVWFQRFWTNGVRVAVASNAPAIQLSASKSSGGKILPAFNPNPAPVSITNTPSVNFAGGDFQATAGQTIQIPVTATVFGSYPLRVAMLNISVVPLDGSPALTTPVSFSPGAALGAPTSGFTDSHGTGNYAAAWLDSTIAGISNSATVGTLTVTIPANATSLSSYAIHFDHASGSPNGIASFPKHTLTGLITLSSRTNSYYNDGIPDSWRLRWFGTIYNVLSVSNACPSGDGVNNWGKYVAGVDPNTPNDFPSLNPNTPPPSGAAMSIYWPTASGKQYAILSSASLFPGNWITNAIITGNGSDMEFDDNSTGKVKFYRVLILP